MTQAMKMNRNKIIKSSTHGHLGKINKSSSHGHLGKKSIRVAHKVI